MRTMLLILACAALATAQETKGAPEAQAKAAEAKTAQRTNDFSKAAELLAQAIQLDPSFYDAHTQYVSSEQQALTKLVPASVQGEARDAALKEARETASRKLLQVYAGWAEKYPANPVVQYMLGELYEYKDWGKTESYSRKALEKVKEPAEYLANLEGLVKHMESVKIRFEKPVK